MATRTPKGSARQTTARQPGQPGEPPVNGGIDSDDEPRTQANVSEQAGPPVCPRCGSDADGNAYCATCGLHLAALPSQEPDGRTMSRAQQILLPIVAVVALVAVGLGIFAIASDPQTTTLRHDVSALQIQLKTAHAQIVTLKSSSAQAASQGNVAQLQASVTQLQGKVGGLQNQTSKLITCVPQLQQELNGLNVTTANTNGWLTSAYLSNQTIISQDCTKTLNGH